MGDAHGGITLFMDELTRNFREEDTMKRFLFAISMVLVFGLSSAMAQKAKETGVVAHWGGTYIQDEKNPRIALTLLREPVVAVKAI
jgi:hypothetical protein